MYQTRPPQEEVLAVDRRDEYIKHQRQTSEPIMSRKKEPTVPPIKKTPLKMKTEMSQAIDENSVVMTVFGHDGREPVVIGAKTLGSHDGPYGRRRQSEDDGHNV